MALRSGDNIFVELENASLWWRFSSHGTEMIITKSGRYKHVCFAFIVNDFSWLFLGLNIDV